MQYRPDVIIVPERGAGPLAWAVEEFVWAGGETVPFIAPNIGTHLEIPSRRNYGMNNSSKRAVIENELRLLLQARDGIPADRAIIIDEVQSGTTLTTAAKISLDLLTEIHSCKELKVVAVQDSRVVGRGKKRVDRFKTLAANEVNGLPTSTEVLPLFYIDRQTLLNYIISNEDADGGTDATVTYQNMQAQLLFRSLAIAYKDPQFLRHTLSAIDQGAEAGDLGSMLFDSKTDQISYQRVYRWVASLMSQNFGAPLSQDKIVWWLKRYLSVIEDGETHNSQ